MHIAIIGCGQLARMIALAGMPLGINFSFVNDNASDSDTACVDGLGSVVIWQTGDNIGQLYQSLGRPDVVSVEKEQVELSLLRGLALYCTTHPNVDSVAKCKSRIKQKQLLRELNIPCADFSHGQAVSSLGERLGFPLVIKSLEEGYDGKNQWVIRNRDDLVNASPKIAPDSYLAEQFVHFEREVSIIGARDVRGNIRCYPLTENQHDKGILLASMAPAQKVSPAMTNAAEDYFSRLVKHLDYVGVLAIELFVINGELLVNELAPRVHNSGHWTQLGGQTCQFENHIRAIAGLPLGNTEVQGNVGMLNLLGTNNPPMNSLTASSSLHWYNKQPKPNRKLGHINFSASNHATLQQQMASAAASIDINR
ncbi:5-(carboxyamino)imidazole ribonucleotide synthase [Shewanella sp. GutDb-MelDb]|uniref:5-(carboxyamino)imidazole ribonucleotide synthase n=1 Tax=Shewanella sp. GutDb-MelDb TaxID=2058316 RepID=UPI000C7D8145|nr:5-(carboxyamino)imidazole ribonucleotide synthase [Shewanella sp. GutDb-MelDb]PKG59140.1 5-(carboxyamino)imidazole ribonucleotide synthase [Shewanella sp. GutDb-MelDb]